MRPDYVVEQICNKTQKKEIKWYEHPGEGFFVAKVNDITLHLIGSKLAPIMLVFSDKELIKQCVIQGPHPHLSKSPIGRFLSFLRKSIGLPELKGPKTAEEITSENLRVNLEELLSLISKQCKEYYTDEYYIRTREEIFSQVLQGNRKN